MSFTNSSQVKVPLTNPYVKYGKTFRISNLYIESSNLEQIISELNPSSMRRSNYAQNFQTSEQTMKAIVNELHGKALEENGIDL